MYVRINDTTGVNIEITNNKNIFILFTCRRSVNLSVNSLMCIFRGRYKVITQIHVNILKQYA